MTLSSLFYRSAYRFGRPAWDSGEPRAELKELLTDRRPGRALDLGCGTGTDAIYLARAGWAVTGVDFVPGAIETARAKARATNASAVFVVADVSRLREAGVEGPFDLIIDIGCYHGIPTGLRDGYAREVTALARAGADFLVAGISDPPTTWRMLGARGVDSAELRRRFGRDFTLSDELRASSIGRRSDFGVYHLVRKPSTERASQAATTSPPMPR